MTNQFPQDFLWGVATAGHQVEGNNVNSDTWFLEQLPGSMFSEPSGDAVDHYHRYREDIALIAELGFTSYRFSLEWARIEPAEGQFSVAALDHYKRVLEACVEHGLTPVVTFHHFASPLWLLQSGGWEGARTAELFARYCDRAMTHLGHLIGVACTLNEPNLPWLLESFGIGGEAPENRGSVPVWAAAAERLGVDPSSVAPFQFCSTEAGFAVKLASHQAATAVIKAHRPDLRVGWTLANSDIQSIPGGEAIADKVRRDVNERFLEASRGDDFVGIQTYGRTVYGPEGHAPAPDGVETNQMGEEIYPQGLEATIREAARIAGIPVIVTENGLATEDDTQRLAYLQTAVEGVASCLADGIEVGGYIAWTAFDNYEWVFGYRPKFGLIAVDRTTQERTPKESAHWLGSFAREHAASQVAQPA
ncbi:glycoside hydrolase family 1 [Pseudarthrobacter chlorophenolicus A6]|uniref:Glycoside hydrolase family 1 n=1 Tax=Pseudarthrobacter chlorophenolicus (strain ATCC 700700 / DSM 12829 / CIP 107037 / JCM 12360 / KCTC 9906 / NCIMB 13794 / A6) TaxID=452863 RepID=B8HAF9_PSECP|nr:family 1 glycosylhydrolase [Pseudarthrobacter chlorophenolicus]ACL38420.1 glycoside hydrolase family 1 [Pseudarthrobacter chlorophenolicus A6]SDQ49176.1 aryl-beta-glucosidase [Pseudarthrobacter chlorophenolicus]